ncbi:MAG TPA: hypothetical protein VGG74_26305 [Kofleriaceae bacterium]
MLEPLGELLVHLAELVDAIAARLEDSRWSEGAAKMHAALAALRTPSERELAMRTALERDAPARHEAERQRVEQLEKTEDARWIATLKADSDRFRARDAALAAMPRIIRAVRKGQAIVRNVKRRA